MSTEQTELIKTLRHLQQQTYAANRMHESQAFKDAADQLKVAQSNEETLLKLVAEGVTLRNQYIDEITSLQAENVRLTAHDQMLADVNKELLDDCHRLIAERDALQAKVAALEGQEPVAWCSRLGEYAHIEWGRRTDDYIHTIPLFRAAGAAPASTNPEATAEQFIQAAIDNAPEPLRRLGEYLSRVLDEDQWATAEAMLLAVSTAPKSMLRERLRRVQSPSMRPCTMTQLNGYLGHTYHQASGKRIDGPQTSCSHPAQSR